MHWPNSLANKMKRDNLCSVTIFSWKSQRSRSLDTKKCLI